MKTYLLFLYSTFNKISDIEYFCLDVLGVNPAIKKIKFLTEEKTNTIIVVFDSDFERKELSNEIYKVLYNEFVKFYFLFDIENVYTANLPVQIKEFLFNNEDTNTSLRIEYDLIKSSEITEKMDLDIILEKIKQFGVESLTSTEKKFLDNFNI